MNVYVDIPGAPAIYEVLHLLNISYLFAYVISSFIGLVLLNMIGSGRSVYYQLFYSYFLGTVVAIIVYPLIADMLNGNI